MSDKLSYTVEPADDENLLWQSRTFCLCAVDATGEIVRFTPGFAKLIGGAVRPASPLLIYSLIHPEDRSEFTAHLDRICSDGIMLERRQVRMVTPDGRVMLMEVSGESLKDSGKITGAMLAWWDCSGDEAVVSWSSTEERDDFEQLLASFTTSLFDPVVLLNTEARIIHFNPPVQEILGYSRTELIGHPVAVLFEHRKDQIQKAMLRFAKMMRAGQIRDLHAHLRTTAGEKIPVTISSSMIRSGSGELMGMVLVARDERENVLLADLERKNRELEKAYQELKNLDIMKDDFLSLVGHELRAPLANILGYTEFLKQWELTEQEKKEYLEIIYQESQHLRRLVNDILDLSRMEAGRVSYNSIRSSVNRVVRTAMDSQRALAEQKGIRIVTELEEQLEPIDIDPDKIQQVVSNIVHNAIKFSDPETTVTITTSAAEDGIKVSVADQGIGIPEEFAEKVFNKFEQVAAVKHHSEGAGLGMSIAKHIIEEGHGGRIWFESPGEGKGTAFIFTIPERRPEP
jgi:two-component system phosphate regulon sensor histidine kinase PhoR